MRDARSLSVVLAEQTARTIQAVDLIVQQTLTMVLAHGTQTPDQFRQQMGGEDVHVYLVSRLKNLPQADALALVDGAGRLTNSSNAWAGQLVNVLTASISQYFRDQRFHRCIYRSADPEQGQRRVDDHYRPPGERARWCVPRGRRWLRAGALLRRFLQSGQRQRRPVHQLVPQRWCPARRHPNIDKMIGEKLSSASTWYEDFARGGGTYRTLGYIGGVPQSTRSSQCTGIRSS